MGKCDYPQLWHSDARMRKALQHNRGAGSLSEMLKGEREQLRHYNTCICLITVCVKRREFMHSAGFDCIYPALFFKHICMFLNCLVAPGYFVAVTSKSELNNCLFLPFYPRCLSPISTWLSSEPLELNPQGKWFTNFRTGLANKTGPLFLSSLIEPGTGFSPFASRAVNLRSL